MSKRVFAGLLSAALAVSVLAGPVVAKSEKPAPDDPGCVGLAHAWWNHFYDVNPNANESKGPGWWVAKGIAPGPVNEMIAEAREYCD